MVCEADWRRDGARVLVKRSVLADIGGTNARFAVLSGDELGPIQRLEVRAFPDIESALRRFMEAHVGAAPVDAAVLAVAGPVEQGRCQLTNSPWIVDSDVLRREFGFGTVRLVNDLEAVAASLPYLRPGEIRLVGSDRRPGAQPVAVLSPGTGLGMACRLPDGRVVASEGGHATLAASNDREDALIGVLRRQHGHVSAERVLSGDGLVSLHRAIRTLDRCDEPARTAPEITAAALAGSSPGCREALDVFCAFLGAVAGDAALFFAARGGVVIGGGIVPRIVDHLGRTEFRPRFEAKGRFHRYLADVPAMVVLRPDPAFLGLAALAGIGRPPCTDSPIHV